jgi:hypothetical protein
MHTDLIFDWISNLLGWIEPTKSNIQTFSLSSQRTSTIYSGLKQPVSLTLDAHNGSVEIFLCLIPNFHHPSNSTRLSNIMYLGFCREFSDFFCRIVWIWTLFEIQSSYLFWISGSSRKSIMRGTWSRNSPQLIVSSAEMANPSSLQYDVTSKR